jgi:hypothetical protein
MKLIRQEKSNKKSELPFEVRATAALGISIVADALDYIGAPIFALPIVGDISDTIVITFLYRLTGSKTFAAVNAIEFIPFIGDMLPTYTVSTLLWILRELHKRRMSREDNNNNAVLITKTNQGSSVTTRIDNENYYRIEPRSIIDVVETSNNNNSQESLRTKTMRLYAIFRSRMR